MSTRSISFISVLVVIQILYVHEVTCLVEGLYCGKQNCYDVLGVTRDSTKNEIAKAYRSLAKKYHPDLHREKEAKDEAENIFKMLATAYEVLKDDASREDYDYMLDHPEEFYNHYIRYYKRATPDVDWRIVIAGVITLVSAFQYYNAWQRYEDAIKYFTTVPKYRLRATEIAKQEKLWNEGSAKKGRNKAKEKEEQELIIRKVIEEKMDIRGGYAKPKWTDVLWIQLLIILPYTSYCYISWYIRWIYKFKILNQEYGDEEKLYLVKQNLKLSRMEFEALEDSTKFEYIKLGLWKKSIAMKWLQEKEEETKRQLAENPRYKSYRRYMKNHGPGRLTFDDS